VWSGLSQNAPTINVQDPNPKKCDRLILKTASFLGGQNYLKFWGKAIKTINLIFFKDT
jgi:hypothetical protein